MRVIVLLVISLSVLTSCKRGERNLEVTDIKPINRPKSPDDLDQKPEVTEWSGLSDLSLSGLWIVSK